MRADLLWSALIVLNCCVHAQSAAAAVDDGPLLCLATREKENVTLRVCGLHGEGLASPFWTNRCPANVLARLDRDRLLLASHGDPYALIVVDLASGSHRILAEGTPTRFVAVHGKHVLHLGDARKASRDDHLYATPWQSPDEQRPLATQQFERVPQVAGNLAICITLDETAVWLVSIVRGTGRAVWTAPAGARELRAVLSPGGQHLAVSCVQADGQPLLAVVDAASARLVRSWTDLRIGLPPISSFSPTVEIAWQDDTGVVCSETRGDRFVYVRRSVGDGEVTDEHAYAESGLYHVAPRVWQPVHSRGPAFIIDKRFGSTRLRRVGSEEALTTVDRSADRDFHVAPDGRSAIAHLGDNRTQCTLFTDRDEERRLVANTPAFDFVWLPGVGRPLTPR